MNTGAKQERREHEDVPGSYGHYEQDARTLAGWGVDMGARRNGLNLARP